jgi:hypothetical protein
MALCTAYNESGNTSRHCLSWHPARKATVPTYSIARRILQSNAASFGTAPFEAIDCLLSAPNVTRVDFFNAGAARPTICFIKSVTRLQSASSGPEGAAVTHFNQYTQIFEILMQLHALVRQ